MPKKKLIKFKDIKLKFSVSFQRIKEIAADAGYPSIAELKQALDAEGSYKTIIKIIEELEKTKEAQEMLYENIHKLAFFLSRSDFYFFNERHKLPAKPKDFRGLGDEKLSLQFERFWGKAIERHDFVRNYISTYYPRQKVDIVNSFQRNPNEDVRKDAERLARKIEKDLGTNAREINRYLDKEVKKTQQKVGKYDFLRQIISTKGILIFQTPTKGDNSIIKSSEMSGFAISDEIAPLIVVNSKDIYLRRCFTFIHELAHIYLGDSAIIKEGGYLRVDSSQSENERLCNFTAEEFLLPEDYFYELWENYGEDIKDWHSLEEVSGKIAEEAKCSKGVAAQRIHFFGKTDRQTLNELFAAFVKREKPKGRGRNPGVGKSNAREYGEYYLKVVGDAYRRKRITNIAAKRWVFPKGFYGKSQVKLSEDFQKISYFVSDWADNMLKRKLGSFQGVVE